MPLTKQPLIKIVTFCISLSVILCFLLSIHYVYIIIVAVQQGFLSSVSFIEEAACRNIALHLSISAKSCSYSAKNYHSRCYNKKQDLIEYQVHLKSNTSCHWLHPHISFQS